jgi:hypothetical protein
MPPTRMHKVILHVSKPSTPDTPAATPVPLPLSSLELHHAPQTPPLPPPQPPNQLPSNTGLPIPNGSQHSVGTQGNVPTYTPPHASAGMFYPPLPVYPQHPPPFPPYGGINTLQPWSYAQYTQQLAELSHRFPVHPLATEHATTGAGDSHADAACSRVANGPADQDLCWREDTRVGGARVNVAASEERVYPNEVVGPGSKFHSHLRAVKLLADCLNLKSGNSRLT